MRQRRLLLDEAALPDALVPLRPPLAASSTPSQLNAFCLVLFDSSDRLSEALARNVELVLAICLKHGPAYDVASNDVRDLILGWIQAGWIRSLVIDYFRRFGIWF